MKQFQYNSAADTLFVLFTENQQALGFEIHPQIFLRLTRENNSLISVTFMNFTYLRSQKVIHIPLKIWIPDYRRLILSKLLQPPLNELLLTDSSLSAANKKNPGQIRMQIASINIDSSDAHNLIRF